jgi:hypothetical protein
LVYLLLLRPFDLLAPVYALWLTCSCLSPLVYLLLFMPFGLLGPV